MPVDPHDEVRKTEDRLRKQHAEELRRLKENADREFTPRLKLMEEQNDKKMEMMMHLRQIDLSLSRDFLVRVYMYTPAYSFLECI